MNRTLKFFASGIIGKNRAICWYLASLLVVVTGSVIAAGRFPGGFDWAYTVASALASQKHNPEGSFWFAGALGLSMAMVWPSVSTLNKALRPSASQITKSAIAALRFGLICGALVGLERLFFRHLSDEIHKAHEVLALLAFLSLYWGVLGLLISAMLRRRLYIWMLILVASPLLAIGITQFWLYLDQRDLGWVGTRWRELGVHSI